MTPQAAFWIGLFWLTLVICAISVNRQLRRIAVALEDQADALQRMAEIEMPVTAAALGEISQVIQAASEPVVITRN